MDRNNSASGGDGALCGKMRSYNALSSYPETHLEMDLLKSENRVKDNIIADLKARLGKYERIYVKFGTSEPVVVGPSKSLLESLCKEICKQKQKNSDMEVKATQQVEEIQRLSVQLKEKDRELERLRCQPDHEKDQEIHRLRSTLEERESTEATRAALCTSLAEEANQMRSQLGATVKVCQELLARLDKDKRGGDGQEAVSSQQVSSEVSDTSDANSLNTQILRLKEENQQLKQRVSYVQGLNTQWQKYDSSREDYIRGLCQRLKESPEQGLMMAPGSVSSGLLHQEITRLNALLEKKMSECEQLEREAASIRRKSKERIETLEQQVLIYTEDFKSERADRERAQGQINDLKEQVHQLKRQLNKQQGASRDMLPVCCVHIGHRISSRRHKDSSEPLLRASADSRKQPAVAVVAAPVAAAVADPAVAVAAAPHTNWNTFTGLSELQCPRCLATFHDRDAAEYLNHCEECAKV